MSKINNNNNKKINKCNTTYCGNRIEKKIHKEFLKFEKFQNKLINSKTRKYKNNNNKFFTTMKKKISKKEKEKSLIEAKNQCRKLYCNINCKDTLLEPKKLSKKFIKENKILVDIMKTKRKELFGNKTNVLENNFYNKLPKKTINKLHKEGALSLCTYTHYE